MADKKNTTEKEYRHWAEEDCYAEAKKFKTKADFRNQSSKAYSAAVRNGWLKDYSWLSNKCKWTYDDCYELAKECSTKREFRENNNNAYTIAARNGWLKDYTWLRGSSKWQYDSCYKEAKKYKSKGEFRESCSTAYAASIKNGWINDYTWLTDSRDKWTYEMCYEEALKYDTGGEFNNANRNCYEISRQNGWLNDFTWLKRRVGRHYWTKEKCYNEAKNFSTKLEFQMQSSTAYHKAYRNGWLKDYTWLKTKFRPEGYWTYETCFKEAQNYISVTEFKRKNSVAYNMAKTKGWLEDYKCIKKRPISNRNEYLIYAYKDDDLKSIYVGLTRKCRLLLRDKEHRNGTFKHGIRKYDGLYNYFFSVNKEIPNFIILKEDLYAKDAQYYENYYIEYYKSEGWNILNKTKGGSLGAVTKWTREKCYEEAKKCISATELINHNRSCYETARRNGWLSDYSWFERKDRGMRQRYWTEEKCYDIAIKCSYASEMIKYSKGAYSAAYRNGWIHNYTWFHKKN